MTSKRDIETRLDDLEPGPSADGFHLIQIGGDPDTSGWYSWNSETGVYENDAGFEIPPEEVSTGDSEVEIL